MAQRVASEYIKSKRLARLDDTIKSVERTAALIQSTAQIAYSHGLPDHRDFYEEARRYTLRVLRLKKQNFDAGEWSADKAFKKFWRAK